MSGRGIAGWLGLSLMGHAMAAGALLWIIPSSAVSDDPLRVISVVLVETEKMEKRGQATFSTRNTGKSSLSPFLIEQPDVPLFPAGEMPITEVPETADAGEVHDALAGGPGASETASAPPAPETGAPDAYRPVVLAALDRAKHYPALARQYDHALEGVVGVAFTIHPDGRLSNAELTAPSRHALLNRAALALVRRVGAVPPPPPPAPLRFTANIEYRLQDSP